MLASRKGDSAAARTASDARCMSAEGAPIWRSAVAGITATPRPSAAVPGQLSSRCSPHVRCHQYLYDGEIGS